MAASEGGARYPNVRELHIKAIEYRSLEEQWTAQDMRDAVQLWPRLTCVHLSEGGAWTVGRDRRPAALSASLTFPPSEGLSEFQ